MFSFTKYRNQEVLADIEKNTAYVKCLLDGITEYQSKDSRFIIEKVLFDVIRQLQTAADDGVKIERVLSLEPMNWPVGDGFLDNKFGISFDKKYVLVFDIPDKLIDENTFKKIVMMKLQSAEVAECLQKFFTNINKKYEKMIDKQRHYPLGDYQPAGY